MKYILISFLCLVFISCEDASQKSDKEKAGAETSIEVKTDSGEVKINGEGIAVSENGHDSVSIKINSGEGIKVEGKDGKVELKTDGGGKIKIEKKGKEVDIKIKEN